MYGIEKNRPESKLTNIPAMKLKIAVLIPCCNEAKTINKVIDDYDWNLKLFNTKIYVYDNNSTDGTKELITKNMKCIPGECGIQGKGATIKKMLDEIDADIYIMTDGDDTYPAERLFYMVSLIHRNNADMVIGIRKDHPGNKNSAYPPMHRSGNRFVDRLISLKYKTYVADAMSGLRIFTKDVAKGFAKDMHSVGFTLEVEMLMWCLNHGYEVIYRHTPYKNRINGSTSKLKTFRDGTKIVWEIIKTKRIKQKKQR